MPRDRLLLVLCLTSGLQTFSIGAFPALLPELGRSAGLPYSQLGAVAGAFGFGCSPFVAAFVSLHALLALLPDDGEGRPWFARSADTAVPGDAMRARRGTSALAFAAGCAVALAYATLEQFVIPVRGSREFGLERPGIARLLMLAQLSDTIALLPVGALADRVGTPRVLGVVLLTFAAAVAMVGVGPRPMSICGC